MSLRSFNLKEKNHKYSLPFVSTLLVASLGVSLCLIFVPFFAGASSSVEGAISLTETPAGNVTTKVVAAAGIAGGGTSIFTALMNGTFAFSEFSLIFTRIWSLILAALGLRKHREPWGTVYDSVTKQPLDPAYVILQDKNGEEVATSITDLDGRFGFLVPPGTYRLIAQKTNYIAPSLHLYGKNKDEVYDNLYFGDEIEIESSRTITRNIPMDPQGFDWNEFAKRDQKIIKLHSPRIKNLITKITNFLFFVGLLFSVFLYAVKPDPYNTAILALYVFIFILRFIKFKTRSYGIIIDKSTGLPLPFAIVRVFQKDTNREMFHRIADLYGHYYCLLAKGEYYITIEKKEEDGSYIKVFTSEPFVVREGIVNTNFLV